MASTSNKIGPIDSVSYTSNKFLTDNEHIGWKCVVLDKSCRDSTNTPTTVCREGLVLGEITAQLTWRDYNNSRTDGSGVAGLILAEQVDLVDPSTNAAVDSPALCVYQARVSEAALLGIDSNGKTDLAGRIYFDA